MICRSGKKKKKKSQEDKNIMVNIEGVHTKIMVFDKVFYGFWWLHFMLDNEIRPLMKKCFCSSKISTDTEMFFPCCWRTFLELVKTSEQ